MSQIQIPEEWKLVDFTNYVFFQGGPGLRTHQFTKVGMKVVNVTNLVNGFLDLSKTDRHISLEEFEKKYRHFAVEKNDILMASSGATFGKTAWASKKDLPLMMNTSVIRLHPNSNDLTKEFLWYFLNSNYFLNQIKQMITGSAQPNFGPTHLTKVKMLVPPLEIQKKIVQKLDYIFEQLKEKKKEILEYMENNTNLIKFLILNYNRMVIYSEMPKKNFSKNYKIIKLSTACKKITSGGTPSRNYTEYFGGKIPWLKIGDLNEGIIFDSEETITEKGLEKSSAKLFSKNTVLIAMYGATIGKTGILGKECATNQAICGMICVDDLNPKYLLYFLQSMYYEIRKKAEGGAQPNINQEKIKNLEITMPDITEQEQIVKRIENKIYQSTNKQNLKQILEKHEKIKTHISNLQNAVLIKAFTGKLVN